MNDQKDQIIQKLQTANNILVTVSSNPSVDQLSACIGLTLLLNKLNKHATAVFSGHVPSTIEFLKPRDTIESNTDSLRDFIIALDKSKADKLRYKVEDEVVKIFITPYKASITEKDLIFSQGDFNVDVVMALGVHKQQDLDAAITAHGRILHDAVVISINNTADAMDLGVINWQDLSASSMSEMVTTLAPGLGENLLDDQIATALLTGIVADTDHFSNQRTTPQTMISSASLLAAGANQQLVATELGHAGETKIAAVADTDTDDADSTAAEKQVNDQLKISHVKDAEDAEDEEKSEEATESDTDPEADSTREGNVTEVTSPKLTKSTSKRSKEKLITPTQSEPKDEAVNTAYAEDADSLEELFKNAEPQQSSPGIITLPEPAPSAAESIAESESHEDQPLDTTPESAPSQEAAPIILPEPSLPASETTQSQSSADQKTLTDLEEAVNSPHLQQEEAPAVSVTPAAADASATTNVDSARQAVQDALSTAPVTAPEPLIGLNAVPVNLNLGHDDSVPVVAPAPAVFSPDNQPPDAPSAAGQAHVINPIDPGLAAYTPPMNGINIPPPATIPPTSAAMPTQGPPPPPVPPPMPSHSFTSPQ